MATNAYQHGQLLTHCPSTNLGAELLPEQKQKKPYSRQSQLGTLLLLLMLICTKVEAAQCIFQWYTPEVNTKTQVSVSFAPDVSAGELGFDLFQVWMPVSYAIPDQVGADMQTFTLTPDSSSYTLKDTDFVASDDIEGAEDTASSDSTAHRYKISIKNLKAASEGSTSAVSYTFSFYLTAGPFEVAIDTTNFDCLTYSSTTLVEQAAGASGEVTTNSFSATTAAIEIVTNTVQPSVALVSNFEAGASSSSMTINYTTTQTFLSTTWVYLEIPKSNYMYSANSGAAISLVDGDTTVTSFVIGGVTLSVDSSSYYYLQGTDYAVDTWAFTFTDAVEITSGQAIVITVSSLINPPLVYTLDTGWTFSLKSSLSQTTESACSSLVPCLYADYDTGAVGPLTTTLTTTSAYANTNTANSIAIVGTNDGIGVSNAEYTFTLINVNMVPTEGVIIINVPLTSMVPDYSIMTMTCSSGCDTAGTITWDSSSLELTITGAFGSVAAKSARLVFNIAGWTNPPDSSTVTFSVETQFVDSSDCSSGCAIESFNSLELTASEGLCYVQNAYVTDLDTRIYAQVTSYTFVMWCNHEITSDMGLKIVWPSDYIVMDQSSCTFTGYDTRYYCQTISADNEIVVRTWTSSTIAAKEVLTFTVDSVISPGTFDSTGEITLSTMDSTDVNVDVGTYTFSSGYFTAGNITTFTVAAADTGVGIYPVSYTFNVVPNGEVDRYGYLQIDLPPEVEIIDVNDFETSCGLSLYAFTHDTLSCTVTNSDKTILVKDGFQSAATTNLTDTDGSYNPPDLYFTLSGFQNPREAGYSSPWNVTIYNTNEKVIYYWTTDDAPTLYVSGVAAPAYIEPIFENKQNGNFTWLELLVTTTAGLAEGDKVVVRLPFGWQFSADSEVFGRSNNLGNAMEAVTVSTDQRQLEFTAELSYAVQRRLRADDFLPPTPPRHLQAKIDSGLSYQFRITNMKNFYSMRPSDASIEFAVYSSAGTLIEEQRSGMLMQNNEWGPLSLFKNGIIPGDFRTDFESNYTLSVNMENFEKNMAFTLTLPDQINFATDDPYCTGLSGTDNDVLKCETDRAAKTIKFTNAMQFANANPGEMRILIENLKNPVVNEITSSFSIQTETYDGFFMDRMDTGITINFYCEYPCANCPQGAPSTCDECYQTSVERYFYLSRCLAECPVGMVEVVEDLTCIDCISPCVTCDGTANFCTECIDGYYIVESGECRERVTWYFPFIGMAFFFFVLISISECVTKRASNFKESLIAFWSIPELLAWACVLWFMWHRVGQTYQTALGALAAMMYICINMGHALYHPRYMVPNTLYSYKQLLTDYKCGTFIARTLSYLFSFKFSLILVSNFFGIARLSGDYSAMNWKQFNRFSLVFCLFPYSCMMASCVSFIMADGFWSYPGFVAAEVICLSTIISMLLLVDAFSAIKCKTVGKSKTNKAIRVATGADYESDEDEMNLKKQVARSAKTARRDKSDQFGIDEESEYGSEVDSVMELKQQTRRGGARTQRLDSRGHLDDQSSMNSRNSKISQQTQIMNEEARKQIAMLEELAHQMREEKRQLQEDKDKIEREKYQLQDERGRTQHHLEAYMDDYQRQTTALSNTVRDMEKQKIDLVQSVETRLDEGNRATALLAQKVAEANNQKVMLQNQQIRKNFRDFEGEMEDYEPVEEENSSDAESSIAEVVDSAQLPVLPAFGQIDYFRQIEGDDQHWMQQITPRAGGDSMLGQHDQEDDMELQMDVNATAHYEVASIPPTEWDEEMENGVVEAEFQEMTSQLEANQSEEFQQRSDAEMEIDSQVDQMEAVEEQWFVPERAIFSQLQERDENEINLEHFTNELPPVFERFPDPDVLEATEVYNFQNIVPKKGEADPTDEFNGSEQHFFKPEEATYGAILEDADHERHATAQQFFNPLERAANDDASDAHRSGIATPMEYLARGDRVYGDDVEDPNVKVATQQQMFNAEPAVGDSVSNFGRSYHGSDMVYQAREQAYLGKDVGDDRQRDGTEHQYFNREDAMYSQDKSMANKNATASEFFKHDEAVRGDITSGDRSVAATQQNYFTNDKAELGRPDSYSRFKSDIAQDYVNKSDLGGMSDNAQADQRHAAGRATPHQSRIAEPIDYMNKSEAEYGRQSSVHEQDATQSKFFEQEQNPEFGRGENFTRNVEVEQEYNPPPEEDESGRSQSESSEGGVADHGAFTSGVIPQRREGQAQPGGAAGRSISPNDPQVQQVRQAMQPMPNAQYYEQEQQQLQQDEPGADVMVSPQKPRGASLKQAPGQQPMHQQQQAQTLTPAPRAGGMPHMQAPTQPPMKQAKTILYSDKSETSVEDLMDDTPSNYNIQNGRFEGKSLGLKALLLHARNYQNQTLDPQTQGNHTGSNQKLQMGLAALAMADQVNKSPQQMRPGDGMLSPGMAGAQKGIIGSQNDERNFVNNLYQTNQSIGDQSRGNTWRAGGGPMNGQHVPVIGEESSNNGDGSQVRNTRNQVRTNKQFQEDPRAARGGRGRGGFTGGARSPNVQNTQQMGRGVPRVTKNNFLGGST